MPNFKRINWSGYKWITKERWGYAHSDKPNWWYDPNAVHVDNQGYLHLHTHYNPEFINEDVGTAPIGAGLISAKKPFGFGQFEIEAQLPSGPYLWPAFWTWAWEAWPPEIDVVEAYSNFMPNISYYLNSNAHRWPLGQLWKLSSNLHYTQTNSAGKTVNQNLGAKQSWIGLEPPHKRFIKFTLNWQPDVVEIYYDDYLNRQITDSEILDRLSAHKMNVVINNGITRDAVVDKVPDSDFIIKSFKFTPFN